MNDRERLDKIRKAVSENQFSGTQKEYETFRFLLSYIDKQQQAIRDIRNLVQKALEE